MSKNGKQPDDRDYIRESICARETIKEIQALAEKLSKTKSIEEGAKARSGIKARLSLLPDLYRDDAIREVSRQCGGSLREWRTSVETLLPKRSDIVANQEEGPEPSKGLRDLWERYQFDLDSGGRPVPNIANVVTYMRETKDFWLRYDTFHHKLFVGQTGMKEWDDQSALNLAYLLQSRVGLRRVAVDVVDQAARVYGWSVRCNEPRDWLETLKWDGNKRIEGFLAYYLGAEDNRFTLTVSKNFWVALAARVYAPGCRLDNMLVLEGAQGIGKTQAMRIVGGPWYTESLESVTGKDFFLVLQGKLVVEVAELDSFSKGEATRIKQVITCTTDRYRAPYAHAPQDYPRSCVFVGTTNEEHYLRDDTGGRRFWPVRCGAIKLQELEKDREQLFAEAVHLFKQNATWHEVPPDLAAAEQEARRQPDAWEDILAAWGNGRSEITLEGAAAEALKLEVSKLDTRTQMRIGSILRRQGWTKHSVWRDGVKRKLWQRKLELPIEATA